MQRSNVNQTYTYNITYQFGGDLKPRILSTLLFLYDSGFYCDDTITIVYETMMGVILSRTTTCPCLLDPLFNVYVEGFIISIVDANYDITPQLMDWNYQVIIIITSYMGKLPTPCPHLPLYYHSLPCGTVQSPSNCCRVPMLEGCSAS